MISASFVALSCRGLPLAVSTTPPKAAGWQPVAFKTRPQAALTSCFQANGLAARRT
jgi:hypothetical protein